jgi:hypothetical protein
MSRRVSFEILTVGAVGLLLWLGVKASRLFSGAHTSANYLGLLFYAAVVTIVWFASRRIYRDLEQHSDKIGAGALDRLTRNSMAPGVIAYVLIYSILSRH